MKQEVIDTLKDEIEKFGILPTSDRIGISITKLVNKLKLSFKTFDDIKFIEQSNGVRGRIMFDNGYGASVVCHEYSYGGKKGLYELAVLDKDGELTYDTPITDGVMGYLSPEDVTEILIQIQDLKN